MAMKAKSLNQHQYRKVLCGITLIIAVKGCLILKNYSFYCSQNDNGFLKFK